MPGVLSGKYDAPYLFEMPQCEVLRGDQKDEHAEIHEVELEVFPAEGVYLQKDLPVLERRVPGLPLAVRRGSKQSAFVALTSGRL